jgi:serine/threonine protein kinase/tetratricopeptide (TPR) repeat protein
VYEAEDPELKRRVALKVLTPKLATDEKFLSRFKREAQTVAALSHPNVVTLYSVEESEGTHFLTMELVRGEPLHHLIPEGGFDLRELLDRAIPLVEGLRAAHEQGIVHRDLKPGNVMVDQDGRVRILDFGLAKQHTADPTDSQEETMTALTAQGAIVGTVPYMSPEQVSGQGVDQRSDIFSLGIILHEMCLGVRPFRGETATHTMSAILRDRAELVSEIRGDLPEHLGRIVRRCLEKEPSKRYQTARVVKEELEDLKHEVESGQVEFRSVTRPTAAVGKWWLAAAAVGVLALVGFLIFNRPVSQSSETESELLTAVTKAPRKMIAVLPFQNLGSLQDEYFAIGMTEEIASRMASVRSIGVIATSSTRQYADTQKTAQEIGDELGAGYLVTGSILWARSEDGSSRIRITPQLVSTVDAIHTEIASQVVSHLGISLADPERAALAQFPTDNLEAYDAYLRALAAPVDITEPKPNLLIIEGLYRAVELDPHFALAWLQLTVANSWLYTFGYDTSEERRRLTLEAALRVEEVDPGSALAAAAMGHYEYRIERNYDRALKELSRAVELDPNNSTALRMHGAVLRRRAEVEAATESYEAAVALDPRNYEHVVGLAIAYQYLREYEKAVDAFDRAIALAENHPVPHRGKVEALWSWAEDLPAARQALEAFPMQSSPTLDDYLWYWQAVYEGDLRAAADRIQTARGEWLGMTIVFRPRELLAGLARLWLGEPELAREQFEFAVAKLQARLIEAPDNQKMLSSLGVALAALGRRDQAIEAALQATEIVPLATDPWFAQTHLEDLAWVYTLLGDYDSALDQLEILLERPSRLTISFLELDPRWAPLRSHQRFEDLKAKYGKVGNVL